MSLTPSPGMGVPTPYPNTGPTEAAAAAPGTSTPSFDEADAVFGRPTEVPKPPPEPETTAVTTGVRDHLSPTTNIIDAPTELEGDEEEETIQLLTTDPDPTHGLHSPTTNIIDTPTELEGDEEEETIQLLTGASEDSIADQLTANTSFAFDASDFSFADTFDELDDLDEID